MPTLADIKAYEALLAEHPQWDKIDAIFDAVGFIDAVCRTGLFSPLDPRIINMTNVLTNVAAKMVEIAMADMGRGPNGELL